MKIGSHFNSKNEMIKVINVITELLKCVQIDNKYKYKQPEMIPPSLILKTSN